MDSSDAFIIAAIGLFSFGHPIGGAVALVCSLIVWWGELNQ